MLQFYDCDGLILDITVYLSNVYKIRSMLGLFSHALDHKIWKRRNASGDAQQSKQGLERDLREEKRANRGSVRRTEVGL